MRAADLAEDFPFVDLGTDALEATALLVQRALPGLVVVDSTGLPVVVLPSSQVLRVLLPDYVEEDASLAAVVPEAEADQLCRSLAGRTVGELIPDVRDRPRRDRDRPLVGPRATVMEVASVMSRQRSPMVAVVDGKRILGVITVHRLLGALLPS